MFSAEANLLAPVIIVISTTAFGVIFFFHLMYDMGQELGVCLFSVEIFPFLFRSWQILLVSASAIFSIGLTIFTSFLS